MRSIKSISGTMLEMKRGVGNSSETIEVLFGLAQKGKTEFIASQI